MKIFYRGIGLTGLTTPYKLPRLTAEELKELAVKSAFRQFKDQLTLTEHKLELIKCAARRKLELIKREGKLELELIKREGKLELELIKREGKLKFIKRQLEPEFINSLFSVINSLFNFIEPECELIKRKLELIIDQFQLSKHIFEFMKCEGELELMKHKLELMKRQLELMERECERMLKEFEMELKCERKLIQHQFKPDLQNNKFDMLCNLNASQKKLQLIVNIHKRVETLTTNINKNINTIHSSELFKEKRKYRKYFTLLKYINSEDGDKPKHLIITLTVLNSSERQKITFEFLKLLTEINRLKKDDGEIRHEIPQYWPSSKYRKKRRFKPNHTINCLLKTQFCIRQTLSKFYPFYHFSVSRIC